jgi:hypothetical protein
MALRDITRAQVLAAIEEYDALGQEGFWLNTVLTVRVPTR